MPTLFLRASVLAAAVSLACGASSLHAGQELLDNPGFEQNLDGWTASGEDASQGLSKPAADAAHTGKQGLHVAQTPPVRGGGSSLGSRMLAANPGESYQVEFWARCREASGVGVFLQFFDDRKQLISTGSDAAFFVAVPASATDWKPFRIKASAPERTAWVVVWIHAWSNASCNADFDDFSLVRVETEKSGGGH